MNTVNYMLYIAKQHMSTNNELMFSCCSPKVAGLCSLKSLITFNKLLKGTDIAM